MDYTILGCLTSYGCVFRMIFPLRLMAICMCTNHVSSAVDSVQNGMAAIAMMVLIAMSRAIVKAVAAMLAKGHIVNIHSGWTCTVNNGM